MVQSKCASVILHFLKFLRARTVQSNQLVEAIEFGWQTQLTLIQLDIMLWLLT